MPGSSSSKSKDHVSLLSPGMSLKESHVASDSPSIEGLMIESVNDSGLSRSDGKRSSFHTGSILSVGCGNNSKRDVASPMVKKGVMEGSRKSAIDAYHLE